MMIEYYITPRHIASFIMLLLGSPIFWKLLLGLWHSYPRLECDRHTGRVL